MNAPSPPASQVKQHLIDPAVCIRCNTCEATCPVGAVTHDDRNYVVKPDVCNGCGACVPPCPTGSIDHWLQVLPGKTWSIEEQLTWDELPDGVPEARLDDPLPMAAAAASTPTAAAADAEGAPAPVGEAAPAAAPASAVHWSQRVPEFDLLGDGPAPMPIDVFGDGDGLGGIGGSDRLLGAAVAPRSAAAPVTNTFTRLAPAIARVVENRRVVAPHADGDVRHIVLDFGDTPFPVLEGQSIGVLAPGVDRHGRAHHARQYSVASPRDGDGGHATRVALTVKRTEADPVAGTPAGVCSNWLCDLAPGADVPVMGPFGHTFLMPDAPDARLLMVATGTGIAPMRGMLARLAARMPRRDGDADRHLLVYGGRTDAALPYADQVDAWRATGTAVVTALSRVPDAPKRHVQDALRDDAERVAEFIADPATHLYVCGLKGMERGVLDALRAIAGVAGLDWPALHARMRDEGRVHVETY
ncbi:MAG: 4Fe-4S binding protein [Burkholderiales bacterium]|nr:4Fe-4S binding protein [Burkholderiales bacterium]